MHIHILGICGTFMGGIAALAKAAGHRVTGQDAGVYPPMSTQLEALGIELIEGFDTSALALEPDVFVVGNAMARGNPMVEAILNAGLPYTSGPQWLAENVLNGRHVLGVAGTHGKTTTSSMLAWILEYADLKPGFLIGGVPGNFSVSARLGEQFFVVEADEYDTAFFDKRSKFVHYHPKTLVLNNLEFDHADIFSDLAAIQRQFHHVVRTVPANGRIVCNAEEKNLTAVLEQGCWTPVETFAEKGMDVDGTVIDWQISLTKADGSEFAIRHENAEYQVQWDLLGKHNVYNGVAAMIAACNAGVSIELAVQALAKFQGVKRRCEVLGSAKVKTGAEVTIYDDFAHHPTAIATTLAGLRAKIGAGKLIAVFEPRSNTMQMGVHKDTLAASFALADEVMIYQGADVSWDISAMTKLINGNAAVFDSTDDIVQKLVDSIEPELQKDCHIVVMSNGGFGGIHKKILNAFNME